MPRIATIPRQESNRPAKRMKLVHHRRDRRISILGSVSKLAGFASRLFSPVGSPNEQFESASALPVKRAPPERDPWSSSISLLSVMAEEHANMWDQLEYGQDDSYIPGPAWIGIQSQSRGYDVHLGHRERQSQSFLDMDDSDGDDSDGEDTEYHTPDPATGHSVFSDWDSDYNTDDSDLTDGQLSPTTSTSSLPSPSACAASAGHSFWDEDPTSGDEYWDRQTAIVCARHIRDAFPNGASRGKVPLERFIVDVLRATRGSVRDDVAFVALQFIRRLVPTQPLGYYEDLFFTSLILADKVENDDGHTLKWWSERCNGTWSISELRFMESRILQALDWNLSTSINCRSSYQSFLCELSSFAS